MKTTNLYPRGFGLYNEYIFLVVELFFPDGQSPQYKGLTHMYKYKHDALTKQGTPSVALNYPYIVI